LHTAKARFEGILEIAEDAIISIDSGQCILLFNQGAEKVFGYTATEVIGKPLDLLLPQRFANAHREHIEEFAKAPEVSRSMAQRREVFGRRKDGREFPAEASISKLDLGAEVVFTVILRDITERKEAAEALRASAQLVRGQAEALTRTLDALAKESAPERLVEHVLRTIIGQLDAHSSGVWLRSEAPGLMNFEFAFENGTLITKSDAALAKISPTLKIEDVWPWPEVFRTGRPSVLEDIREGPSFPWREHVLSLGVVTILIVPMLIAGQVEGVIGIRFTRKRSFRGEELELAQALAHQAMLAIQLGRLSRQSRQAAVAAERNRMARDIHDTLAQGFTGVILQLEAAEEAISQRLAAKAGEHLARAGELAREGLQEARRSVWALRPRTLEEKNLCEALRGLIQKMTSGTPVRAEFIVQGQPRELPLEWEENLLRIEQEVLTNVMRHAQASEFNAQLAFDNGEIRLNLRDNGSGFDPGGRHDGFGLQGMRERVEGMGGQLSIQSARGDGTAISIVLPFANAFRLAA
jgi:PAS domain S-box-containing protein